SQLLLKMKSGEVDLAMGGGRRHFIPEDVEDPEGKTGRRTDGRNLVEEAIEAGAQYAWDDETFAGLNPNTGAPLLGLFESSHIKYEHDRTGEPSFAEKTETAINYLSANEEGFYLSIEAGRVDHANHDGNAHRTLTDGVAFADAVAKAMKMTSVEDTLIIVTADHEHAIAFNGYCGRV
ncbi:MAG: alkaline phosphatase, partial [Geminicoccaceae bacterium]